MEDIQDRLKNLQERIARATNVKNQLEAELKVREEQLEDIKRQIENEGLKPEDLDRTIADLEEEIREKLTKIENLLPPDLPPEEVSDPPFRSASGHAD